MNEPDTDKIEAIAHDKDKAFRHKWNYACASCGAIWQMNYYDLLRLTEQPEMPCGCGWQHLSIPAEQPENEP